MSLRGEYPDDAFGPDPSPFVMRWGDAIVVAIILIVIVATVWGIVVVW